MEPLNELSATMSFEDLEWRNVTRSRGFAVYNAYIGFSDDNVDMPRDVDGDSILAGVEFRHDAYVRVYIDADADAAAASRQLRKIADHVGRHGVRPASDDTRVGWIVSGETAGPSADERQAGSDESSLPRTHEGIRDGTLAELLEVVLDDPDESLEQSLAVLRAHRLIEHNGEYRNGRPGYVLTSRGQAVRAALPANAPREPR